MTEPTATLFEEFSGKLRRNSARRDEALEAVDAEYTGALATGTAGEIYPQYLAERQSVISRFQTVATSIHMDYVHRVPPGSPFLPTPPAPSAACPPPRIATPPAVAGSPTERLTDRSGGLRGRKTSLPVIIIGACILALVTIITVSSIASISNPSGISSSSETSSSSGYVSSTRTVLYEVEGTAEAVNITYEKPTGIAQQTDLSVPLTKKGTSQRGIILAMDPGDYVYISAQNQGASGTVTCRITVDGVVISTVTSRGGYTIATCKGTAP